MTGGVEIMNTDFERVLSFLRNCKSKGLSEIVVDVGPDFDILRFEEYVNKLDKRLIYSSKPSFSDSEPGVRFKLYQTEEAFLDELIANLLRMYSSRNYNKIYCPHVPDYLKPYDIKKWFEFITSEINIVKDMIIDHNGILCIYLIDTIENIKSNAEASERERIYALEGEAFARRVKRIVQDAIDAGRSVVEFSNIDTYHKSHIAIPDSETMELINRQSIIHIKPEEVFTFAIMLCTNDIDKVFERFEDEDLEDIARQAIGASSSKYANKHSADTNPDICVYKAEVITDPDKLTKDQRPLKYVKAWCYILKKNITEGTIDNINQGIRGGVSIDLSCNKKICSICGKDTCDQHIPGEIYDGKICYNKLKGIVGVYHFTFTRTPCQSTRVFPIEYDNVNVFDESEFDSIMRILYRDFMDKIEGFSYIAETKSLQVNLKVKEDD